MPTPVFARTPDEMATRDQLLGLSGLDFMQAMLAGTLPHPPIARLMNYHLDSVEKGRVVFRGTPEFDHLNPSRGIHGGWYGTILDSCLGCAVMTELPKGTVYTTLEYKVNLTRAIPLGTQVLAEGISDHAGRSTAVAHATLRGAKDGKLYATASTTCLVMRP